MLSDSLLSSSHKNNLSNFLLIKFTCFASILLMYYQSSISSFVLFGGAKLCTREWLLLLEWCSFLTNRDDIFYVAFKIIAAASLSVYTWGGGGREFMFWCRSTCIFFIGGSIVEIIVIDSEAFSLVSERCNCLDLGQKPNIPNILLWMFWSLLSPSLFYCNDISGHI